MGMVVALAFSPDSRWIVANQGINILVLTAASGICVRKLDLGDRITRLHFSADGRQLITECETLAFACDASDADAPEEN
jgi:WD40 repeat protein